MQRQHLFAAIAVTLGLAVAFCVSELAVRLLLPRSVWDLGYARDYVQADPLLGWTHKPHVDIEAWDQGRLIGFKTNGDGVLPPDAKREKRSGALRVLMLGDSTTVGRAVPEEGRVHRQLERQLRERGIAAEVINAGVEGYATDQALLRLEALEPLYAPDFVVHTVCDDDVEQNLLDEQVGEYKPRFLLRTGGELELAGPRRQQISSGDSGLGAWAQYSALYRGIQPAVLRVRAALGNWNDRNLLGLGNEVYYSHEALEKRDWRLFDALIARMAAVSRVRGGRLYLALHPALEEVWEPYIADTIRRTGIAPASYDRYALEHKISEIARKRGIGFIAQIDEFRRRAAEGPFHLLPRDPHCNELCYQITASLFAARIAADYAKQ